MNELYTILMSWAITLSGYPAPEAPPETAMVPHSYLVEHACGGHECKVMGWFPPGNMIYLDDRLKPANSLYASSIVVHEMAHYLQYQATRDREFSCESAIEME